MRANFVVAPVKKPLLALIVLMWIRTGCLSTQLENTFMLSLISLALSAPVSRCGAKLLTWECILTLALLLKLCKSSSALARLSAFLKVLQQLLPPLGFSSIGWVFTALLLLTVASTAFRSVLVSLLAPNALPNFLAMILRAHAL